MIDDDIERIWGRDDLCRSADSVFIATGVCDGRTPGVEDLGNDGFRVHSEIIDVTSGSHYFKTSEL